MKNILIILLIFTSLITQSQNNPLAGNGFEALRIDYMHAPKMGDVDIKNLGFSFRLPLITKTGVFVAGLKYNRNDLSFRNGLYSNNLLSSFNEVHNIYLSVMYMKPLKNDWLLNALIAPTISSTLHEPISSEDFIYNSFVSFTKKWEKNNLYTNLTFGLAFGTIFGEPRLFPLISYNKQFSEKLKINIGLPSTGVFYDFNHKNSIDFTASPEGFFANNSSSVMINNQSDIRDTKLQFNSLKLSLGYHLKFDENWITHFNFGYIPFSELEVLDKENNLLIPVNTEGTTYFNLGVSFNLNTKNK